MKIEPEVIKGFLVQYQDQNLKFCPPLPGIGENTKLPAAVLIPLFLDQGTWKLLFIKRAHHNNDHHSGQIAFPGGRVDQVDTSLLDTALREVEEEIGIDPADVEVLGQSCPITTVTNYEVTPIVGILPWPYPLTLAKIEVDSIITIPVAWLVNPNNHQTKSWISPLNPRQEIPVIFFNEYEGEILWGATAQIVMDFLEIIQIT